jgi:hypothetical protein
VALDPDGVDPDLLARIEARFGPLPERRERLPVDAGEEELRARRERASRAADPALLDRLEEHGRRARRIRLLPPAPASRVRELARLDLGSWRLPEESGDLEYEPPDAVVRALGERVPQALLRDLHRPELHFGAVSYRTADPGFDPLGEDTRAAVRSLMRRAPDSSRVTRVTAGKLAAEGMAELRALLSEPWERARPEAQAEASLPGFGDLEWFGTAGGYDPDQ